MKKEDSIIKLSIITPYYKTLELTKELSKVLEPQLTNECEWIIIDDGCNEKELDILKAKIIHKNNGGVSSARNSGLDIAKGKYITFIDSDDNVMPNYIEKILNKIETEEFDYCLYSWKSIGKFNENFIIKDLPPSWNTSVWNCIYKRELIGNKRFDTTKRIMEDGDFNKKVRNGKKANIEDILYIYYSGRPDSLIDRYSKGESKMEDIKTQFVIYRSFLSKLGGIETAVYNACNLLKDTYDIVYVYDTTDIHQIKRLNKLVKCVKYAGQNIICDTFLYYGFNPQDIGNKVKAKNIIQHICCDVDVLNFRWTKPPYVTKITADSKASAKAFMKIYPNEECGVLHNLFSTPEPKRVLNLMSASRLSPEKGYDRMKKFAKRLNEKNIPFEWTVFTNDKPNEEIDGFVFREPRLNVTDYMSNKDYGIQLSNTESWGCTITEFLECGVPIISTDFPSAYEQVEEGINGYILKRDLSNMDEVIDNMYNNNLKGFKYEPKYSVKEWVNLIGDLGGKKDNYEPEEVNGYEVEVIKPCFYTLENKQCVAGDILVIETEERLNYLVKDGYVKPL